MKVIEILLKDGGRGTPYLTGLRAYLALAVILIHVAPELLSDIHHVSLLGRFSYHFGYAVVDFYVLSAYSLGLSLLHAIEKTESKKLWSAYAVRRFFRLYPLYAVLVIGKYFWDGRDRAVWTTPVPHDGWSVFIHLTFLNVFDFRRLGNALGVEWSVTIEVWASILYIPLFFMLWRSTQVWKRWMSVGVVCITAGISYYYYLTAPDPHWWYYITAHAFPFLIGVATACIMHYHQKEWKTTLESNHGCMWMVLFIWLMYMFTVEAGIKSFGLVMHSTACCAFLACASSNRFPMVRWVFQNPVALLLGNVSYSIYLTHFIIFTWMMGHYGQDIESMSSLAKFGIFVLYFTAVVCVSILTFLIIEYPFIQFGQKLSKQILQQQHQPHQPQQHDDVAPTRPSSSKISNQEDIEDIEMQPLNLNVGDATELI